MGARQCRRVVPARLPGPGRIRLPSPPAAARSRWFVPPRHAERAVVGQPNAGALAGTDGRILLLLARGALVASGVFLLAGGMGYELVTRIGDRGAGAPLPELTLSAATAKSAPLPPYARLIGTTPRPELTWLHDHSERRTSHRDAFTPLTAPGWRPGDPVAMLEEDRTALGEDGPDAVLPPGPVEGALGRGTVPGRMLAEMRRRGVAITDDPAVLVRRKLDGVVPGSDTIGAVLCLLFGGMFALVALAVSFRYRYRRRHILHALAAAQSGSARTIGRA